MLKSNRFLTIPNRKLSRSVHINAKWVQNTPYFLNIHPLPCDVPRTNPDPSTLIPNLIMPPAALQGTLAGRAPEEWYTNHQPISEGLEMHQSKAVLK